MLQVAEAAPRYKGSVSAADDARDFALLRRAICERDEIAWVAVVERYTRLVRSWVRQHPSISDHQGDEDARVNRAFERFWRAVPPERFENFANLASLLQYLKVCAGTVTMDEVRSASRRPAVSLDRVLEDNPDFPCPRAADDPAAEVLEDEGARAVWALIERELPAPADRRLAYLSFVAGLTPAAIHAHHPEEFGSVVEVYRRKATILERLRRSRALRAMLPSTSGRKAGGVRAQAVLR
jgi:DNA-directed RNA polymerase specialized sigma24 family protein